MSRYQIYLRRGNDFFIDGEIRLTPDTLIIEKEGRVIAEFYREAVGGWKESIWEPSE